VTSERGYSVTELFTSVEKFCVTGPEASLVHRPTKEPRVINLCNYELEEKEREKKKFYQKNETILSQIQYHFCLRKMALFQSQSRLKC